MRKHLIAIAIYLLPSLALAEARILVLGDSNTWGSNASGARHDSGSRWGAVMGAELEEAVVIEEGRIGRRTDLQHGAPLDNIGLAVRTSIPQVAAQHMPLDLAVIMLGTNDLQAGLQRDAETIARSAFSLARILRAGGVRQVLVVAPPPLIDPHKGALGYLFGAAEEPSERLASAFSLMSQWTGIPMFDAGQIISADGADGVHLSAEAQRRLGQAIAPVVQQLLRVSAPDAPE
ncbi:hypothetical protein RA19_19015 [Leisingera sp. ANG-M1]|uniref:GDSL-type esterase/lipase family protein n=1 Tax=Leisingera sp. ANG-M1 TaxID=1577895 RepID=UPI00057CD38A|nr:GDSL-type esterase/lipase family protein [Leisingera sp. ANG-M1]KIC08555.1 hypothetical protein RA19_19015 [Leisingera sp. ANG-M1]